MFVPAVTADPAPPSSGHQAAVPVPAAAGRRHGQHPFAGLQPLVVPHLCTRYDGDPRTTHHVRSPFAHTPLIYRKRCLTTRLSLRGPNVSGRKRKLEEDERQTIPNILQGEVARLDVKFLVNLDPSYCSSNGTVHLVCKLGEFLGGRGCFCLFMNKKVMFDRDRVLLDDKNLPSVPPLQLSVPADYPDQSPYWADDGDQYGESPDVLETGYMLLHTTHLFCFLLQTITSTSD